MHCAIRQVGDDVILEIKVHPGAKKTEATGMFGDMLKMKIAAKPEDGAANRECIAFLSKKFGIPQNAVMIIKGAFSRMKTVKISGISRRKVADFFGIE